MPENAPKVTHAVRLASCTSTVSQRSKCRKPTWRARPILETAKRWLVFDGTVVR